MRDFRGPKGREESPLDALEQEASPSRGGGPELRQADESLAKGMPIAEVARSLGVSEVTLHRWRAEYGAVDRDAVKRLEELEKENSRLKRLVADQQLDIQILKEVAKGEF
jgi:transposase-like protein